MSGINETTVSITIVRIVIKHQDRSTVFESFENKYKNRQMCAKSRLHAICKFTSTLLKHKKSNQSHQKGLQQYVPPAHYPNFDLKPPKTLAIMQLHTL